MALIKMENMLGDPLGLFGGPGWSTHASDLQGRINQINAIISLGEKMGCDMSAEKARARGLHVPSAPRPK